MFIYLPSCFLSLSLIQSNLAAKIVMANATIALNSTNTTSTITKAPVSSAYSTQITNSTTSAVNNSTTPAVTVTVTVTANATTTSTKILP